MEKLIQDKQYFKLIAARNRLSGKFNRDQLDVNYQKKDWIKSKITLEQISEVIDSVEAMCDSFRLNRLIYVLHLICAGFSFSLVVLGIVVNVKVTTDSSSVRLYNFWDLSWPYFTAFVFIPIIAAGLFFVNKHFLNKYEKRVSSYFADININIFEKQQVIWKIGELCSYIDISQISRLRSRSVEANSIKQKQAVIQMGVLNSEEEHKIDNFTFEPKSIFSPPNTQDESQVKVFLINDAL